MRLPVALPQYSKLDQDHLRDAIAKNDLEVVHFGRDIPLARGEKLILYSADGTAFAVTVSDEGALNTEGGLALSLIFTPGGDGVVSFYRIDATHAQFPRTAVISSIASDVITLTAAVAATFFQDAMMNGVSYIRIWNTTKNPDEQAWVKAQPANNQLTVVSAAAIATWANGDTIQVGDPLSVTPNDCAAVDISPMLLATLGRVFPQRGLLYRAQCQNIGAAAANLALSENGVTGSFQSARANNFDGSALTYQLTIPCSVLSPVSNSNLVFVREIVTGANMGISLASAVGVWV